MAQPATTEERPITAKLRGAKLVMDLDEHSVETVKHLAKLTEFDPADIVIRSFTKGLNTTFTDAQLYNKQVRTAKDTFMNTGKPVLPLPSNNASSTNEAPPQNPAAAAPQLQYNPSE